MYYLVLNFERCSSACFPYNIYTYFIGLNSIRHSPSCEDHLATAGNRQGLCSNKAYVSVMYFILPRIAQSAPIDLSHLQRLLVLLVQECL